MLKTTPYSNYVLLAIENIKLHIDKNPFCYKKAAELLEHFCTPHRNNVEKAFKNVYGCGIKEYQVRQRLNLAKQDLMEGVPKKFVAKKCFYGSISAFSTAFKKEFGVPPTEWENNWRYEVTVLDTAKM